MQHAHFQMGGANQFVIKHYAGDVSKNNIFINNFTYKL